MTNKALILIALAIGFVATPGFAPDLVVSLDWYNIRIEDRIGGLGADNILLTCLDTADPFFCDRVHRARTISA